MCIDKNKSTARPRFRRTCPNEHCELQTKYFDHHHYRLSTTQTSRQPHHLIMAQGTIKSKPRPSSKPSHKSGITKKGGRTVAPKKANLIKAQKITKKLSSGLTAQTEKMLGEKAGHLEMLGQGGKKKGAAGADKGKGGKGDPKKEGWKKR